MPILLQDLAEEASASIRRAAERLDEEFNALRHPALGPEELRQTAVESARQATSYAVSRLPEAEAIWQSTLTALRTSLTGEAAERLLRTVIDMFGAGSRLFTSLRALWGRAEAIGAAPERLDDLDRTRQRFDALAAEARLALEHRTADRQPADPTRLAQGLQLARDGKTIPTDEARARFRRG